MMACGSNPDVARSKRSSLKSRIAPASTRSRSSTSAASRSVASGPAIRTTGANDSESLEELIVDSLSNLARNSAERLLLVAGVDLRVGAGQEHLAHAEARVLPDDLARLRAAHVHVEYDLDRFLERERARGVGARAHGHAVEHAAHDEVGVRVLPFELGLEPAAARELLVQRLGDQLLESRLARLVLERDELDRA